MAAKAIFRTAAYSVTDDDATSVGQSTSVVYQSVGVKTPNKTLSNEPSQAHGQQRIDTLAQMTGSPLIAAAGTYILPLSAMLTSERVLIRVVAPTNFHMTVTPLVGPSIELDIAGSSLQPGIFELTFETAVLLAIVNNGADSERFTVTAATVVDYDDPRLLMDEGSTLVSNLNLAPGLIPLGGIIPLGGTYSLANNAGVYDEGLVLPLPGWLQYCDGSLIVDTASIMFGRFVPDISDNRFIMGAGSTAPGLIATAYSGANTRDITHIHTGGTTAVASVNTTTRTTNVTVATQPVFTVDAHTHIVDVNFTAAQITQPTFTVDAHTHGIKHVHQWAFQKVTSESFYSQDHIDTDSFVINAFSDPLFVDVGTGAGVSSAYHFAVSGAQNWYTTGVLSAPSGVGNAAQSGVASVSTTTQTTNVAIPVRSFGSDTALINTTTRTVDVALGQPTFTVDAHTHAFNVGAATWNNATVQAAPTAVDIRPRWISFKYYMRIK